MQPVIKIAVDVPFPAPAEANQALPQSWAPIQSRLTGCSAGANHCDWLKPINRTGWRKRHLTDNLAIKYTANSYGLITPPPEPSRDYYAHFDAEHSDDSGEGDDEDHLG